MACLSLGGGHIGHLIAKHTIDSLGLVGVTDMGRCGVSVDVANLFDADTGFAQRHLERCARTIDIGRRNMVAIR